MLEAASWILGGMNTFVAGAILYGIAKAAENGNKPTPQPPLYDLILPRPLPPQMTEKRKAAIRASLERKRKKRYN